MGERPNIQPVSAVFTWFTGALSLLQLIDELTPVKLLGLFEVWVAAYSSLVHRISSFFFGWMRWQWFRIDETEAHVLVLACLLGAAIARGSRKLRLYHYTSPSERPGLTLWLQCYLYGFVGWVLPTLVLIVFLPAPAGAGLAGIVLAIQAFVSAIMIDFHIHAHVDEGYLIRAELLGVISTALVVVLLNQLFWS